MKPIAQIQRLGFVYGDDNGYRLFDNLTATIHPGVTFIQGGDGRGKTTLMRLLAGELKPDSGSIDIGEIGGAARSQLFWLDPRSEAFDQVVASDFFSQQQALYPRFDDAMLARLVTGLDLDSHIHKKLFMLSTGSKRKVFIAAALASGAPLTLLDMPFAAIDKPSKDYLLGQFRVAIGSIDRAIVLADYEPPEGVRIANLVDLDRK